jgi:Na+-driven multidrug efflux pump
MQMQQIVRRFGRETKALLSIAWPLIINNLSVAGMNFTDAVMAGQLGAESLAAVAVGGSVWFMGFALRVYTWASSSPSRSCCSPGSSLHRRWRPSVSTSPFAT